MRTGGASRVSRGWQSAEDASSACSGCCAGVWAEPCCGPRAGGAEVVPRACCRSGLATRGRAPRGGRAEARRHGGRDCCRCWQLSIMKDDPEEAELILHDALRLAYQSDNKKAISYTYDLMANLAFIRGQLENEDNAIIEISLKLASIYAAQNKQEFALAGYEFCISTLEEKIEREKELAEDIMSVEEKANTYLLLGMCLDSCARYLLFSKQLSQAQRMYEKALQICQEIQGERHPQTIVLMSDLATTLDAQGHFDDAYIYMQRASDLAREINHPELHMVLSNLAAILIHRERYTQAKEIYQEALKQAELKRDEVSVQHIREELAELSRKSRLLT
ncbi:tetratricopeptide repeat domain 19 [Cricetulus griseus]